MCNYNIFLSGKKYPANLRAHCFHSYSFSSYLLKDTIPLNIALFLKFVITSVNSYALACKCVPVNEKFSVFLYKRKHHH